MGSENGMMRSARGGAGPGVTAIARRRMYSFEVAGFRLHDGAREDQRFAKVVAATPDDAMTQAWALIQPDEAEAKYRWIVTGAIELSPAEARDWIAWHAEATFGG